MNCNIKAQFEGNGDNLVKDEEHAKGVPDYLPVTIRMENCILPFKSNLVVFLVDLSPRI